MDRHGITYPCLGVGEGDGKGGVPQFWLEGKGEGYLSTSHGVSPVLTKVPSLLEGTWDQRLGTSWKGHGTRDSGTPGTPGSDLGPDYLREGPGTRDWGTPLWTEKQTENIASRHPSYPGSKIQDQDFVCVCVCSR